MRRLVNMVRATLVLSLLLITIPFSTVPAAAEEDPHNQSCQGVGPVRLLCAGADGGSNGDCTDHHGAEHSCWYTYGWNLNASSPSQFPGGGRLEWSYEVVYCITGEGCTQVESGGGQRECSWTVNAMEPCWEFDVAGGELDFVLEVGQCVEVTATVSVYAEAWAFEEQDGFMRAYVLGGDEQGGAACHLDDGRG